jgi:DNA-binding beta-propeller fold protein YncE
VMFEIDTRTNTARQIILPAVTITDFAISNDGKTLYLLDGTIGVVRFYDLATGRILPQSAGVSGNATSIAVSPDDRQIWTTHSNPTQVTWSTGSIASGFTATGSVALANQPQRIYFSPTGAFAAITEFGGNVDIIR